jgi:hypothetical protein
MSDQARVVLEKPSSHKALWWRNVANIVAIMGAWCHALYHRSQAGEAPFGCGNIPLRSDMWSS